MAIQIELKGSFNNKDVEELSNAFRIYFGVETTFHVRKHEQIDANVIAIALIYRLWNF